MPSEDAKCLLIKENSQWEYKWNLRSFTFDDKFAFCIFFFFEKQTARASYLGEVRHYMMR